MAKYRKKPVVIEAEVYLLKFKYLGESHIKQIKEVSIDNSGVVTIE